MSSYTISKLLNPKRVFILQKNELKKRFDPFYYVPELLELEKKVLAKKPKKLRDYVLVFQAEQHQRQQKANYIILKKKTEYHF